MPLLFLDRHSELIFDMGPGLWCSSQRRTNLFDDLYRSIIIILYYVIQMSPLLLFVTCKPTTPFLLGLYLLIWVTGLRNIHWTNPPVPVACSVYLQSFLKCILSFHVMFKRLKNTKAHETLTLQQHPLRHILTLKNCYFVPNPHLLLKYFVICDGKFE